MNFTRFPRTNMFDFGRERRPVESPSAVGAPNYQDYNNISPLDPEDAGPRLPPPRPQAGMQQGMGNRPRSVSGMGMGQGQNPGGFANGARRDPVEDAAGQQTADSLTLGQLKAATQAIPKEKVQLFTYRYDDTDTVMNELEEFYPYVEMPSVAKGPDNFKGSFDGAWTEASIAKRRQYIEMQLESLESSIRSVRRTAQERLLYLLQGTFGETTSAEMQLHWIIENAKMVRSVDGVASLVIALQDANRRYTSSSDGAADKPTSTSSNNPNTAMDPVEPATDRSAELMDILGMLYFIVEVYRTDDTFGDELMATTPPLPLILFQMVSGLKDRLPKGYPVKKVLLLLWKTILACLGGMQEASKAKALSRELAGLPVQEKGFTKASPIDITNWRRDMAVKYPTFHPGPGQSVPSNEKLAEGMRPIPPRPNYHSTEIPIRRRRTPSPPSKQTHVPPNSAPLPGTPAPSPPISPGLQGQQMQNGQVNGQAVMGVKQKKQQFQTDPNRPFIFPFSHSSAAPTRLVPHAIAEADKLFAQHQYVSLGLFQLWQTRDECMREDRGLGRSGLIGFEPNVSDEQMEMEEEAMRLQWRYEEEELDCQERGDKDGAKAARAKLASAKRLQRVDVIYRNTLPHLQSCVIVLLKLLLATVTGPGASQMGKQGPPPGFDSPSQEGPPALVSDAHGPQSREEIDIARHREITSKAVSAILILLLKWFKASHVLKFHYLAQLLFDSNCLLLVLKMFGLTDVYSTVQTKNETEDWNFFRYLLLNCSQSPDRPEDSILRNGKSSPKPPAEESDTEIISEYSWRNFFSAINFLKILQKMTKHRTHRTFMLNQYKSSQILKRMLRANQPMLRLQVLKLIKSQMPWCGRKWRQTNMKVITSIYLNCRPDLRDEWLAGSDQDTELEDALPQENALRSLIVFYNKLYYSAHLAPQHSPDPGHRRSDSTSAVVLDDPALRPSHEPRSASSSTSESDVFPPRKTDASQLPYNPDGMIEFWLHEYEDVLLEVFGDGEDGHDPWDVPLHDHRPLSVDGQGPSSPSLAGPRISRAPGAAERDDATWLTLGEIMRSKGGAEDDGISDSESVVTVGELGDDARMDDGKDDGEGEEEGIFSRQQRMPQQGENTWEHMSPITLSRLPPSPHERRRSSNAKTGSPSLSLSSPTLPSGRRRSSGTASPLRPVMPHSEGRGGDEDPFDELEEDEMDMRGPMPIVKGTEDARERGGAVDEVEYAYGE